MEITAIIMAGGKASRFDFTKISSKYQEKLLLILGERYIIEYVIDAVMASEKINRIIVAFSPFTLQTMSIISAKKIPIELIKTSGESYHSDLSYVIKKLKLGIVITIAGDIPLIKPEILDKIIEKYFKIKKPAMSVMTDFKLFRKYDLKPSIEFLSKNGKKIVPIGINIIDGSFIDYPEIDQEIFIRNNKELLFNINTIDDYLNLKNFFDENWK